MELQGCPVKRAKLERLVNGNETQSTTNLQHLSYCHNDRQNHTHTHTHTHTRTQHSSKTVEENHLHNHSTCFKSSILFALVVSEMGREEIAGEWTEVA